ncbi:MAG TPA: BatA domain-containing protein [Planctomycetota bacterium]|nr:BatA domain-containing protein [Planctomycetota bacterium]
MTALLGSATIGAWIGGFVNSALLAGLGLAAVPIAIHLLNRQRHRPMPWAAMRFVLAAYKRTRRRVQLENLLLLLLRTAAVALLAFAIARPFAGERSPLARLTESRRDLALILDGSASTGYRDGVDSVFEREVARAREILRGLDGARGDRVHMVLAGSFPRLLSWSNPTEALSMLDALASPTDEPLDLAAALAEVLKSAREGAASGPNSALEIRLLTDLQRRSFAPPEPVKDASGAPTAPGSRPALYETLDGLAQLGLRVLVEDLGPPEAVPPNLGIASVGTSGAILGPGFPCGIRVEVQNHGASARHGSRVTLSVDGESQPAQVIDISARGRAEAVFTVAFKDSGEHVLEARLEGDRLAADDTRFEVVTVPPPLRVLLVDGAPAAAIEEDEIGYLRAALAPPVDDGGVGSLSASHPFDPREASPEALSTGEVRLEDADVIWLANVESLAPGVVDKLERVVAGGAALIVSLGDRVTPEAYDARLWRADGSGLLPAEILRRTAVPSRREGYFRVASFDAQCPALSFFADERWKALLTEVPIYEFFAARPGPGARTLATLDDPGSHPLLLERAFDRGRVFLWTTTIDPAWTRLPESPRTLIPLAHELLRYAARPSAPPRNLAPGEALVAESASFPRSLALVRPDGSRSAIDGVAEELADGRWRLPVIPGKDTEKAGLYKIEMESAGSRAGSIAFAVRLDANEGDLERVAREELASLHPALVAVAPGDAGDRGVDPGRFQRGELWRGIALACLAALVCETLWAAWIGRRRSA